MLIGLQLCCRKPWGPFRITQHDTITARIGPSGGRRGYSAITGRLLITIVYFFIKNEKGSVFSFALTTKIDLSL